MDFSAVCLDGMLGVGLNNSSTSSNHNLNQLKHCRSDSGMDMEQTTSRDQDWRSSNSSVKMARTESYVPALMRSTSMISDASRLETSHSGASDLLESAEQATRLMRSDSVVSPYNKSGLSLPFYQTSSGAASAYQYAGGSNKTAGMVPVSLSMGGSGGLHAMGARMNPFTSSQWQELEHQALIFKYMMAGVQVPPELLIPIRKNNINMNMNMNMNIFSSLSGVGSLRPNLGWSSFHLGFANNADPEPGRCRRTDGKKWRCSRDAVPDQKYCERHMNRGRHRSRKPVEGQTQTSHAAAAAATSHSSSGAPLSSSATSLAAAASRSAVTPPNTTSNTNPSPSLANLRPSIGTQSQQHHHQHQQQQQQQIGIKSSAYPPSMDSATPFQVPLSVDRYLNGMKGDLSGQFFDSSSQSMHGGIFNDSGAWRSRIVPQSAKTTNNLMGFESRTLVNDAHDFGLGQMNLLPMAAQRNEQQQEQQRPAGGIRHFFDDWPSSRDRSAAVSWSEIGQMRTSAATTAGPASSATQLSISIPSDFSSPASPNNKLTLSPLKLSTSRSEDPLGMDMGLGVGMGLGIETEHRHRQHHQQTNWIPITWESPVGGPLAEVLNSTSTTSHDCNGKNSSSALNLLTGEGWDCSSNSPRGDTSPTGVLQKTLGSLSDSSTGSSPRAVKTETALCENLRTAAFVTAGARISTA